MANSKKTPKEGTKGSLMNLKKEELVNIILRKDATDREKQEIINNTKENYLAETKKVNALKEELAKSNLQNASLEKTNNEFKEAFDNDAILIYKLKESRNYWRTLSIATFVILAMVVILKIIA